MQTRRRTIIPLHDQPGNSEISPRFEDEHDDLHKSGLPSHRANIPSHLVSSPDKEILEDDLDADERAA
jgi:hypothetical protein